MSFRTMNSDLAFADDLAVRAVGIPECSQSQSVRVKARADVERWCLRQGERLKKNERANPCDVHGSQFNLCRPSASSSAIGLIHRRLANLLTFWWVFRK